MFLTVEEMNLIAMFRQETRLGTIENIRRSVKFMEDREMRELMLQAFGVLERMGDEEFCTAVFVTVGDEVPKPSSQFS